MSSKKINVMQFICPSGFYGAERWILALVNSLDTDRFQGDMVLTSPDSNSDNPLVKMYPSAVGDTHVLQEYGRLSLRTIPELCRMIREKNVDIIHTHGYKSDILGLIAAKKTGIKCVATAHGYESNPAFKLGMYFKIGGMALKYFDIVAPLSPELYEYCESFDIKPERLRLISNGVDLTEIDAMEPQQAGNSSAEGVRYIGYIGRLARHKYVKDLVSAFAILAPKFPELRLRIVGDGVEKETLELQARDLGLAERVDFLGFRDDRLNLMRDLELFCMTSSSEGVPRVMMEAMSLKRPVVAYNILGVDQLIFEGDTGLLAEFGDVEKFANQCEKFLNDPASAKLHGERARKLIEKDFSGQSLARKYGELFEELMA